MIFIRGGEIHYLPFFICKNQRMNEQYNPWKIIKEENVYDNQWINLTHYDVINPSGGKGIYGKIHFKGLATGVIALDDDYNTFLVGQYRFTLNQYSWEIPEGGAPFGEDPLDAAKRELLEEAGIKATSWIKLMDVHLSNSVTDEFGHIYLATGLSQHTAMPEETEDIIVKKLPFEEAYQMMNEGKITDSVSVMAIQKVKLMMLEGTL